MDTSTDHDHADGEMAFELLAGGLGAHDTAAGTTPEVMRACFCLTWAGRLDGDVAT